MIVRSNDAPEERRMKATQRRIVLALQTGPPANQSR